MAAHDSASATAQAVRSERMNVAPVAGPFEDFQSDEEYNENDMHEVEVADRLPSTSVSVAVSAQRSNMSGPATP